MQKLWCVQHKNIKGLQEGYTWDIIKKYVLLLCEMVKLGEIKDMPKGVSMFEGRRELTITGNNHEILWAVWGRDYADLLGFRLMKCDVVSSDRK